MRSFRRSTSIIVGRVVNILTCGRRSRTPRMVILRICFAALIATSCSTRDSAIGLGSSAAATPVSAASSPPPTEPLVGRWQEVRHCQDLIDALNRFGLATEIPWAIGDFFPDETPQQLAKKADPCAGAKPSVHSHFFDAAGEFGSLDQNMQQVDNGRYTIANDGTLLIRSSVFRYVITGGDTLELVPVISKVERQKALKDPLGFSVAAWMVAVSMPGRTWQRSPCEGWC